MHTLEIKLDNEDLPEDLEDEIVSNKVLKMMEKRRKVFLYYLLMLILDKE